MLSLEFIPTKHEFCKENVFHIQPFPVKFIVGGGWHFAMYSAIFSITENRMQVADLTLILV